MCVMGRALLVCVYVCVCVLGRGVCLCVYVCVGQRGVVQETGLVCAVCSCLCCSVMQCAIGVYSL